MHIVLDSLHFFCNSLSFFCRGMSDGRRAATDWVRVAGGAACLCWDAVRDCVLAASAVVEVWIGCWRRRRLVVDGSLGTLGIGVGDSIWIVVAIDLVTRNGMILGSMLCSTLRAGWLLICPECASSFATSVLSSRVFKSSSCCCYGWFAMPLITLLHAAMECISLSAVDNVGLVMVLCWNSTVSQNRSLFVALIWHLWVRYCSGDVAMY